MRCRPDAAARVPTPPAERPTPERCVEAYHLQRTRFDSIVERRLRRRQLTKDGNATSATGTRDRC
jgi:hypothetical protein